MLNKDAFIKFMYMAGTASVRETCAIYTH